jgi:hypothetical protein
MIKTTNKYKNINTLNQCQSCNNDISDLNIYDVFLCKKCHHKKCKEFEICYECKQHYCYCYISPFYPEDYQLHKGNDCGHLLCKQCLKHHSELDAYVDKNGELYFNGIHGCKISFKNK